MDYDESWAIAIDDDGQLERDYEEYMQAAIEPLLTPEQRAALEQATAEYEEAELIVVEETRLQQLIDLQHSETASVAICDEAAAAEQFERSRAVKEVIEYAPAENRTPELMTNPITTGIDPLLIGTAPDPIENSTGTIETTTVPEIIERPEEYNTDPELTPEQLDKLEQLDTEEEIQEPGPITEPLPTIAPADIPPAEPLLAQDTDLSENLELVDQADSIIAPAATLAAAFSPTPSSPTSEALNTRSTDALHLSTGSHKGQPLQLPQSPDDDMEALARISREKKEKEEAVKKNAEKKPSDNTARHDNLKKYLITGAIFIAGIFALIFLFFGGGEAKKKNAAIEEEKGSDLAKDLKNISAEDMRNLGTADPAKEKPSDYAMPGAAAQEPQAAAQQPAEPRQTANFAPQQAGQAQPQRTPGTGGKGANYQKDKDIIAQYEQINPGAAAADGTATGGDSLRYRPRPFAAGSSGTGQQQGGITIKGRDTAPTTGAITLHNVQIKARLKFAIRSSAGNTIIAETTTALDNIPQGAIFYGSASFQNKRTYVTFEKVRIGDMEYTLKASAISGKDPGIASEITEIDSNAKITFKSGVFDAAGKALDNIASQATGGATSGIISNTGQDVKANNEKDRVTWEYRVAAGTTFTIYIE